jgi:glucose-6-phosphate isomerase
MGKAEDEARAELTQQGLEAAAKRLPPYKVFPRNRPSMRFVYRRLGPRMLGRLLAL